MTTIDNSQDVMDSRDIIERLEELQGERDDYVSVDAEGNEIEAPEQWAERNPGDAEELAALEAFAAQLEGYGDWAHGESVIREDYFTKYIEELIDDCYPDAAKSANSGEWPYRHMYMDFEAAADEAKADYTEADFDGVTYLMRA